MSRIQESVFHLMRRTMQEHSARWQAKLPDLTKPQFAALIVIAEQPGIDQTAVGVRAAIDKATLAGLMLRLERRGLVTRTVGTDRRRRMLRLTDAGRAALDAAAPIVDEVNEVMLERLDESERKQLRKLLAKLAPTAAAP